MLCRNTPPKTFLFVCFHPKSNISPPTAAFLGIVGSVLFMFLPVTGPRFSESGGGSSKPAEEVKQDTCCPPPPELFVLGNSVPCTPLVAAPCDTVLRSFPSILWRNVFCLWCHLSIPLLSIFEHSPSREWRVSSCASLLCLPRCLQPSCALSTQGTSLLPEQVCAKWWGTWDEADPGILWVFLKVTLGEH